MNKINFPRISYDGTELTQPELEKWFIGCGIEGEILQRLDNDVKASSCKEKRVLWWIKHCLHYILIAQPDKHYRMTKLIDNYFKGVFWNETEGEMTSFGKGVLRAFNYKGYRENKLIDLAEKLNIKSCPYCNMHYTLFAENGKYYKDKISKFQFDHFFSKADYPFLSMSLYNLIPSCGICNQEKSKKSVSLKFHPYFSAICEQFHFEIDDPDDLFYGSKKDRVEINLIADNATPQELDAYQDVFNIHTLYRRHKDIAQEVFDKAYLTTYYTSPSSFSFLGESASGYIKRLTLGVYPDEKDIEKRPMSKFIQDLWKQAMNEDGKYCSF